ncbi:MAG: hypothetical protein HY553_10980 [Elusimicrobia bacterium]|nr:hypothetical protein [Elusimicrobiota bacterium]
MRPSWIVLTLAAALPCHAAEPPMKVMAHLGAGPAVRCKAKRIGYVVTPKQADECLKDLSELEAWNSYWKGQPFLGACEDAPEWMILYLDVFEQPNRRAWIKREVLDQRGYSDYQERPWRAGDSVRWLFGVKKNGSAFLAETFGRRWEYVNDLLDAADWTLLREEAAEQAELADAVARKLPLARLEAIQSRADGTAERRALRRKELAEIRSFVETTGRVHERLEEATRRREGELRRELASRLDPEGLRRKALRLIKERFGGGRMGTAELDAALAEAGAFVRAARGSPGSETVTPAETAQNPLQAPRPVTYYEQAVAAEGYRRR